MIKGIGVDILNINRIDFKIAKKVLSSEELEIFDSISNESLKREYLRWHHYIIILNYQDGVKIKL